MNTGRELGKNNSTSTTRNLQQGTTLNSKVWSAVSGTEMHPAVGKAHRLPAGKAPTAPRLLLPRAPPFPFHLPQEVFKESPFLKYYFKRTLLKILLLSLRMVEVIFSASSTESPL